MKLRNGSIVKGYGYDDIADEIYRKLERDNIVIVKGKLRTNMKIEIDDYEIIKQEIQSIYNEFQFISCYKMV